MTSLLKNQILKHLTKYTKNLSPEKIKINAFKGEGDVSNLELDENKLTDLLELPNWLKIKRAACNKVLIKVQWTMIKKVPIILVLDEVLLIVEALQSPRPPKTTIDTSNAKSNTGSYGFIERVIDGIKVKINTVRIIFTSATFKANIELMRVIVSSKMPNWAEADHLKKTRVKSMSQGSVILFKEVEWDSTRVEASALQNVQSATPVKLITNSSKIRLVIKKNLSDCSIMESKVEFILNDLFWVLTISQIKAAVLFTESLMGLIHLSNERNKEAMKNKIESSANQQTETTMNPSQNTNLYNNTSNNSEMNNRQKLFLKHDLKETSYHVLISRVEFHFCEEGEQGVSMTKNAVVNGSIRLLICNTQVDLYPYHLPGLGRDHFTSYKEINRARTKWINDCFLSSINSSAVSSSNIPSPNIMPETLMESVTLLRFNELTINCVCSTNNSSSVPFICSDNQRHKLPSKTNTFTMDFTEHYCKKQPANNRSPGTQKHSNSSQQIPRNTIFIQINPFCVNIDWNTIIWLNAFYINLSKELDRIIKKAIELSSELGTSLMRKSSDSKQPVQVINNNSVNYHHRARSRNSSSSSHGSNTGSGSKHQRQRSSHSTSSHNSDKGNIKPVVTPTAIHMEAIMPRIVFTPTKQPNNQAYRPKSLQILIGTLSIDNILSIKSTENMNSTIYQYEQHKNFFQHNSSFPFTAKDPRANLSVIQQLLIESQQRSSNSSNNGKLLKIGLNPLWIEFEGTPNYTERNCPFLEPVHINLNIALPNKSSSCNTTLILCGIAPEDKIDVRLDHYQLMLIYRIIDEQSMGGLKLAEDIECFYGNTETIKIESNSSMMFLLQVERLSVNFNWIVPALAMNTLVGDIPIDKMMSHTQSSPQMEDQLSDTPTISDSQEPINGNYTNHTINQQSTAVADDTYLMNIRQHQINSSTNSPVMSTAKEHNVHLLDIKPTANLQTNRRSYTSLSTIAGVNSASTASVNEPFTSNTISSSHLGAFKSVRNLLSGNGSGPGRMSRKSSQQSLASSTDVGTDKGSNDSDNSDWINEVMSIMEDDTGAGGGNDELDIAEDMLMMDNLMAIGSAAALVDHVGDVHLTTSSNSVEFSLQDIRLQISKSAATSITLGVYGPIVIDETAREANSTNNHQREASNNPLVPRNSGSVSSAEEPNSINNGNPTAMCRIDVSSSDSNPTEVEFRILQQLDLSFLMSSLSGLADLFEDEIAPSVKYANGSSIPPRIQLVMTEGLVLHLSEDRLCNIDTCPGEHAPTDIVLPSGLGCVIDGATRVSVLGNFIFTSNNNSTTATSQPLSHSNQSATGLCNRCNKKINTPNNRSASPSPNNDLEDCKTNFERSNFRMDRKMKELQNQNKQSQNELEILRLELARVTKERDSLRNLINSPSTNLL